MSGNHILDWRKVEITFAIPISFSAPFALYLSICNAALRTKRRALSISALDFAMSETTVPRYSKLLSIRHSYTTGELAVFVEELSECLPGGIRHTQNHGI